MNQLADNTDNTAANSATTDPSGQADDATGTKNQDDPTLAKLQEYEQRLSQFADIEKQKQELEKSAKTAQAEALRWQSSYKSLQSSTTASLQEAARVRQELAAQQRIHNELSQARAEMAQVRDGLAFLASRMGDEDSTREFQLRQRELQIKQLEDAAKQQLATMQQQQQTSSQPQYVPYADPDQQKREFLDFYFKDSGVDYTNPAIDWAENVTDPREAFSRFTTSITKIMRDGNTTAEPVQSEVEKAIQQLQKEREELQKSHQDAIEQLKAQNRRDVEERLRNLGADAGNGSVPSTSAAKAITRLNELDESKLFQGEPSQRAKAAREMQDSLREIRNKILNNQ